MNLICLDSHYFLWGILERAEPDQLHMIPKAKAFFRKLDETKAIIVVPTPLITELLMKSDPSEREKIMTTLKQRCYVKEFGVLAAKIAADIWNAKTNTGLIEELKKSGVSMRTKIKVDTQILAVAMVANAVTLYTEDEKLQRLADGYLIVSSMPEITETPELFSQANPAFQQNAPSEPLPPS
ncbi:MAG TPA: hypothetical protein PLB55_06605 [Prosthecobacter sp.]|nr:hypothetical protein [Prosthecobacter sp.]